LSPDRAMARRTKTEAASTRDTLLDAALAVFRDQGVAHTSLEEIAAAAGVTRGAIYWHFRDKADLFRALCESAQLPMEAMLVAAGGARHDDPLGALRTLAVDGLTRLATDPRTQAVFDVIFHKCEVASEFTSVADRRHSTESGCLANVEHILKQAVAIGQLPRDIDARLAARCVNAFMVGVMHEWVREPGAYDLGRAAPAMVDTMIAGLRAQPPRWRRGAAARSTGSERQRIHRESAN
jgi:TetR/AcrR family acrAB operon transcriptional repressor